MGQYGKVFLVRNQKNNEIQAMKAIHKNRMRRIGTKSRVNLPSEMNILQKLCHINIVRLHEIIDDPSCMKIFLVMDYLPGGTLAELLERNENGIPIEDVRTYFR